MILIKHVQNQSLERMRASVNLAKPTVDFTWSSLVFPKAILAYADLEAT